MLTVVSEFLPRRVNDWLFVHKKYNEKRLLWAPYFPERVGESIRSKFKVLKNTRKPNGDPTCPIYVREANRIQREIERRASFANLNAHADSVDGQEDDKTMEDQPSRVTRWRRKRRIWSRWGITISTRRASSSANATDPVATNNCDSIISKPFFFDLVAITIRQDLYDPKSYCIHWHRTHSIDPQRGQSHSLFELTSSKARLLADLLDAGQRRDEECQCREEDRLHREE